MPYAPDRALEALGVWSGALTEVATKWVGHRDGPPGTWRVGRIVCRLAGRLERVLAEVQVLEEEYDELLQGLERLSQSPNDEK